MSVLRDWKPVTPIRLGTICINSEVLFYPLVASFRLAVGLRVISSTDVLFRSRYSAQFFGEVGGEPGVSVRDDFSGNAVVREHMFGVDACDAQSVYLFFTW